MTEPNTFTDFSRTLREFIVSFQSGKAPMLDETRFNELALALFHLQSMFNAPYRRVCESLGSKSSTVKHWLQIPALPTAAFKEFALTSLPVNVRTGEFHSSGTTEQRPSRHYHHAESLALYEASLWPWFQKHLLGNLQNADADGLVRLLSLTPPPTSAPHSSLAYMLGHAAKQIGAGDDSFLGEVTPDGWKLDMHRAVEGLSRAGDGPPVLLAGTAFQFVELTDHCLTNGFRFTLPPKSRVMETGGYKGRTRALPKPELHQRISCCLGVGPYDIVCEYGMSELSSQAYDLIAGGTANTERCFKFPPWARVVVVSPESGEEVEDGGTGLLRVLDLANVWSVAAVQTGDLAVRRGDGFELIGRASGAELRGCSLMTV